MNNKNELILLNKLVKANKIANHELQIELLQQAITDNNQLILKEIQLFPDKYNLTMEISFSNLRENNLLYNSISQLNNEYFTYFANLPIKKNVKSNYLFHAIEINATVEIINKCIEKALYLPTFFNKENFNWLNRYQEKDNIISLMIKVYQSINKDNSYQYLSDSHKFIYRLCHTSNIITLASIFKNPSYKKEHKDELRLNSISKINLDEYKKYVVYLIKDLVKKEVNRVNNKGDLLLKYSLEYIRNDENKESAKNNFLLFYDTYPEIRDWMMNHLSSVEWIREIRKEKLEKELVENTTILPKKLKI